MLFRDRGGAGTAKRLLADVVVDATGRRAAIARRKGARIAFRDRRVAELVEASADPAAHRATWLDYWSDGPDWRYRIRGPEAAAETWRVRAAGGSVGEALSRVDASSTVLSAAAGEGWIAVGDAASAFDPVASQGLFNALSSALVAAGLLASAGGLSSAAAEHYSDAVAATFLSSEAGRSGVYNAMSPVIG